MWGYVICYVKYWSVYKTCIFSRILWWWRLIHYSMTLQHNPLIQTLHNPNFPGIFQISFLYQSDLITANNFLVVLPFFCKKTYFFCKEVIKSHKVSVLLNHSPLITLYCPIATTFLQQMLKTLVKANHDWIKLKTSEMKETKHD